MTTLTVTANSPVAGSITWSAFQFTYLGITYNVTGGNTTLLYSYFIYANRTSYVAPIVDPVTGIITGATANATLVSSTTIPATLTDDDCIWFINRGGIPLNVQRTSIIDGSLIVTQSIIGTSIAARTIDATNIKANSLTAAEIKASAITTDVLNISTYPPNTIPNGGMEDFNLSTFVPTTWTSGWGSTGVMATYSQTGAAGAVSGSTSTVMAVPANSVEGLASAAAACDAMSYLSGRKLVIQAAFRTTVAAAPASVRVYWGTNSNFTIASGLSASTGTVPTVVELINVDASTASATAFASLAPTPSAAAGVTSLLDYWTGALANNTYLMTGQVAIPQGATWFRVVVSGGQSTYATAASFTWDEVLSQAVTYSTYIGDGVITTRVVAADAIGANQIASIGQRDPVTFQPVNGTNRVEINPEGVYLMRRSASGVDSLQIMLDNGTGSLVAGQIALTGGVVAPVNNAGRVIIDSNGLRGIFRNASAVDTTTLYFDATTGNITITGALLSGGTLTTPTVTAPVVSNGSLTGSVVRTSATVGDGSASSAGVRLDSTGLKGFPANSSTANTTIDVATGVLSATGVKITGNISASTISSSSFQTNDFAPTVVLNGDGLVARQYFQNVTLGAACAATDTSITVAFPSGTPIPIPPHAIYSGGEWMVVQSHTSATVWAVQRGIFGTPIAAYAAGAGINDLTGTPTLTIGSGGAAEFSGAITGGSINIARVSNNDYASNFSSSITDWTPNFNAATWTSVAAAGTPSGYVLRVLASSAKGPLSGDVPTSEQSVLNGEIYTQFRLSNQPDDYGTVIFAYCRSSGTSSADYAQYQLSLIGISALSYVPSIVLRLVTGGTTVRLASVLVNPSYGVFYKAKLRFVGATISAKVWLATDGEPAAYSAIVQSSAIQTAGKCGVGVNWRPGAARDFTTDWATFNVSLLSGTFNVDNLGNLFIGSSTLSGAQASGFAVTSDGTTSAARFKRGGGQTAGTNTAGANVSGYWGATPNWQDLNSGTKGVSVEDNGTMVTTGTNQIIQTVLGDYASLLTLNFAGGSSILVAGVNGRVGAAWYSQGGSRVAQNMSDSAINPSVSVYATLRGSAAGYYFIPQGWGPNGSSASGQFRMTMIA